MAALVTIPDLTPIARWPFFTALQEIRAEAGTPTIREIAERSGYSPSYVHKALRGPDYPSDVALRSILDALDAPEQFTRLLGMMRTSHETEHGQSESKQPDGDRPVEPLSEREVEVLLAWLASDSKQQAAIQLMITASTVNTHLTRIRAKYSALGRPAKSKAALFARAVQDGYTTLDEW